MLRLPITRKQAVESGLTIDEGQKPIAYAGPRFQPTEWHDVVEAKNLVLMVDDTRDLNCDIAARNVGAANAMLSASSPNRRTRTAGIIATRRPDSATTGRSTFSNLTSRLWSSSATNSSITWFQYDDGRHSSDPGLEGVRESR